MADWGLDKDQQQEWDRFVDHFRRETLQGIDGSAFVMSLVPRDGFDVKFAVELGAAVMLDKPLLAIVMPGATVPAKLRLVADEIVEADVDTEQGRDLIAAALKRVAERGSVC
jgi:hypothetical protein